MCNLTGIAFGERSLKLQDVRGRDVLEVGAYDVNGSVRPYVESLGPARYVGVDIAEGPRVDEVLDASQLVRRFGPASFDIVITTEMLEHVRDWQVVISNLKRVLRADGLLLLTTRSLGFHYHGYPYDFWRYEPEDLEEIFADFEIIAMERDTDAPGVFMLARRPSSFEEHTPTVRLHSMITLRRQARVTAARVWAFNFKHRARPTAQRMSRDARRILRTARRSVRPVRALRRLVVRPLWRRTPGPVRIRVKRLLRRA